MDQAHIHLLITHLPIFGSILGGVVLAQGLWAKSNQTIIAAYSLFIIAAIGATIAYLTGEGAEEVVENFQGVAKHMIDQHEDFAMISLISLLILGVLSIGGVLLTIKNSLITRSVAFIILFISLISFGLVARTGYLGGQIRHTEINPNSANKVQAGEDEDD